MANEKKDFVAAPHGGLVESSCLKSKSCQALSIQIRPISVKQGEDQASIFCLMELDGQIVNLLDEKQNQWGFCRLSDKSLIELNWLREQLVLAK
jgi:hypothetical protein